MERNPILRVEILVHKPDGQHMLHKFDGFHRAVEAIRKDIIDTNDRVLMITVEDHCVYSRLHAEHDINRNSLLTFFS